ncbi:MAG: zinc ribbon domain-containing protein [Clostridia bacterium]|nr:zinc ribbon domain-containing protein [Clostridia bacterium]
MYCINCGVKLADTEKKCPLCGTVPYHPDIDSIEVDPLYPKNQYPLTKISPLGVLVTVSAVFMLAIIITLICDFSLGGGATWSGYVIGALTVAYELFVLPFWFKNPSPVVFVPCGFVTVGLYLLYINLATDGGWFMSLAFPVVGILGLVVTVVVTLMRYVPQGSLFIFGGAFVALGAFMPLIEFLINFTFNIERVLFWSLYPLAGLAFVGGLLIFFAVCRPAREDMERKFFI